MAADTQKAPRTERGRRTRRSILDAAAVEFGERGYHDASISSITQRAGVALGTFYTYFTGKDAIFRALVQDMSEAVKEHVTPHVVAAASGVEAERAGLKSYIDFVRAHKEIYRIIDEAEFVDIESWRAHYAGTADRIRQRLVAAAERGDLRADVGEVHAWALMGMNVFLGLRFGVWEEDRSADEIAEIVNAMLTEGLGPGV